MLLLPRFAEVGVGGVCGRLVLTRPGAPTTLEGDESLYWRYESALKQWEGQLGSGRNNVRRMA